MEKPSISFFAINFVMLFAVIGFILAVFDLHRFAFVLELGILLILMSVLAFAMFAIYNNKKWGWTILAAALILLLLDAFFIFLLTGIFETTHMTIVFFSAIGLAIALFNLKSGAQEYGESEEIGHREERGYYPYIDKIEPEELQKEEPKIEKTFTPGKFIASKKANKFHSPKCDWARKISKSNQVWFNSGEEAKAKGFEADKCVS